MSVDGKETIWMIHVKKPVIQRDEYSCGPIACLRILELLGLVQKDEIKAATKGKVWAKTALSRWNGMVSSSMQELELEESAYLMED